MQPLETERLVILISSNHADLFRYIFTLLPNQDDAQDVLQETLLELARKFAEYDATRPFLPWARRFAYHQVLRHRDRNPRRVTYLPTDLLDMLAQVREEEEPILAARLIALNDCMSQLPAKDQQLVLNRYKARVPLDDLARTTGVSRRTLFRRLQHVRRCLYECIDHRTATGGD